MQDCDTGSLPLFVAQAAFSDKEDQGHWNENEGLLITLLASGFCWTSCLSGNHFSSSLLKYISIKLGNLTVDFKYLCLKMLSQIQLLSNSDQKCFLFGDTKGSK